MTEWQAIESAPKDGSEVQVWGDECWQPQAHWCPNKGGWYSTYWDADFRTYEESKICGVTHWMPLPSPPTP